MMFLSARFVACAALLLSTVSVVASSAKGKSYPNPSNGADSIYPGLLEATTEELAEGLKEGLFTSVDLVNVSSLPNELPKILLLTTRSTGIHSSHSGGKRHLARGG
jgi:hypothetical protein